MSDSVVIVSAVRTPIGITDNVYQTCIVKLFVVEDDTKK